ncbi:MAG: response regulator transcription factor [Candidatus Dormibacteraceae bacterium]
MRILIAEDEPGLLNVLVRGLTEKGYMVDSAERGDDALAQLKLYDYDVAIIDWKMPGLSGIEVISQARQLNRPTAIIMLTARDTAGDRIAGLDAGADDYLIKPFDFGELLARVRAVQRRPRGVDGPLLQRGHLALDPSQRRITLNQREVSLSATEFNILELLMRRFPAVVERRLIAQHAWQDETDPIGSNAIDVAISRLRAKLPQSGVRIATVRGSGYRLED